MNTIITIIATLLLILIIMARCRAIPAATRRARHESSQNFKLRVSNPRTIPYVYFKMPSDRYSRRLLEKNHLVPLPSPGASAEDGGGGAGRACQLPLSSTSCN